jgi:hypothetical protein
MILKGKVSLRAKQYNAKTLFSVIASEAWQSLRGKYISFNEIGSLCSQGHDKNATELLNWYS